ncbi:MAG TPA: FAD-binding oxidoreductase [Oscillatoriaceae cyanobacterium M33_DOE_052]|uniref:FAD-binding oxidoreductase n=1 Tax=Planktothricoides sp. SpSt-374 TaxID=2282167 RepID=A0A7C3VL61_9CYAN|nr:FAD-binding oxidoreductase [Oscillatoriaceae cyanobacterium M33_DOE_052]
MSSVETILSQIPGDSLTGLRQADRLWQSLRENTAPTPLVIETTGETLGNADWDVVVAGGTLGIFIGAALVQQGWRVAVIERLMLRGRDQEWNISRPELNVLAELQLLTPEEIAQAIGTEYNPVRIQFHGGKPFWVRDVLNIGVAPTILLETLKTRFLAAGGKLLEKTPFARAVIHPDGVTVATTNPNIAPGKAGGAGGAAAYVSHQEGGSSGPTLKTRLFIDAMGHFSPIVRQARQGQKPDGVCLVVGTCAQGFPNNDTGDLMVSITPVQNYCQYFWEAFPARDGRTTYLFTYADTHPDRPSLEALFADYFRLLPEYQNVSLDQLEFRRALFGFFPSYRQSPLRSPWDRLIFVGDSSALQSPLSFGGFGALLRHLPRLSAGIHEALEKDLLSQRPLAQLMPYQPNISVTWLFQRTMSVGMTQKIDPNGINNLLSGVFDCMEQLGEPVMKPFLQDKVQFGGLFQTLMLMSVQRPELGLKIMPQVGPLPLVDWMQHGFNLGIYSLLDRFGSVVAPSVSHLSPVAQYYFHRWLEGWKYGSGGDGSDIVISNNNEILS